MDNADQTFRGFFNAQVVLHRKAADRLLDSLTGGGRRTRVQQLMAEEPDALTLLSEPDAGVLWEAANGSPHLAATLRTVAGGDDFKLLVLLLHRAVDAYSIDYVEMMDVVKDALYRLSTLCEGKSIDLHWFYLACRAAQAADLLGDDNVDQVVLQLYDQVDNESGWWKELARAWFFPNNLYMAVIAAHEDSWPDDALPVLAAIIGKLRAAGYTEWSLEQFGLEPSSEDDILEQLEMHCWSDDPPIP